MRPVGPQASSGKLPGLPRAPPLGELAGASPTERASRLSQSRCTAISRLFVRAILSQCKSCLSASLPSPSSQAMPLPGLRLPASASLPLASCWPRPQQLLPVSATGGGRRRCSQRERLWQAGRRKGPPFGDGCSKRGGLSGKVPKYHRFIVTNRTLPRWQT